jgi:hypothetical protein
MPLLQAFPFPSTLGEVTLHPLSWASMFIYSTRGKWAFPPLLWSFPPTTTFTSFPARGCWACAAAPACSGRLVYIQFCGRFPSPPIGHSGHPPLYYGFFFLLLIIQFLFFPWVGVSLSGGYADLAQGCLWVYHMPLSSPCGLHLPKRFGHRRLAAAWEPSWFLHLM